MGQALGWIYNKCIVVRKDLANAKDVMDKIQTKVHPLNQEVCEAVRKSVSK